VRQVLVNLVTNAVKFADRGGVTIEGGLVEESEGSVLVRFSVRDTGIGIPVERRQALFESFTQADASTTRRYGGTGLGLAICKRLVEMMGGEIGVESEEGAGSTFWFTLDLKKVSEGAAAGSGPAMLRKLPPEPASGVPPEDLHVLVAEDNAVNRTVVLRFLEKIGIHAEATVNGQEAIEALHRDRYDLVLMDVHMPVMDGLEATAHIREHPEWAELPIIALTASAMRRDRDRCLAAGMNDFLTKPVTLASLERTILKWASARGAGTERRESA